MSKKAEPADSEERVVDRSGKDIAEISKQKAKEVLPADIHALLDSAETFEQRMEIYLSQILIALKPK
jgi:hypothetical protein